MKNVTISLPEDLARWARVEAAKAGKSLSRWLADKLGEERGRDEASAAAVDWYLDQPKRGVLKPGERPPDRDEIYAERLFRHERRGLRQSGGAESEGAARGGVAEDGEPFERGDD